MNNTNTSKLLPKNQHFSGLTLNILLTFKNRTYAFNTQQNQRFLK